MTPNLVTVAPGMGLRDAVKVLLDHRISGPMSSGHENNIGGIGDDTGRQP